MHICKICQESPKSHSFDILKEDDSEIVFYSCLANATKPHDNEGIILHFASLLANKKDKKWSWVIDGKNVNSKMLNIEITILLMKLCQAHIDSLVKIIIINATISIRGILNLIYPLLSKKMKKLIHYE